MTRTYRQWAHALILLPALTAGSLIAAQAPRPGEPAAQTTPQPEVSRASGQDANDTREQLGRLFEQYPPALRQVLRLDPSLMASREYLAMYPALNEFLSVHPEIAHNPSYFVGEASRSSNDPRQQQIELWQSVMEPLAAFLAFAAVLGVVAWLVRTLIDYRRWQRVSRVQAEVHSKLLDRFTANDDLLSYIQTPAGRRFLESAPIAMDMGPRAMNAPIGRILWSLQAGMVLGFGGLGLRLAIPANVADNLAAQPLSVISMLAVAIGVGFVISAAVSYFVSQRLGLFDPAAVRPAGDGREAPTQP
jgi:hypothetical protein